MSESWTELLGIFLGALVFAVPFIALYVWGLIVLRRLRGGYPNAARYAGIALYFFIINSFLDAALGLASVPWAAAGLSNTSLGTFLTVANVLKYLGMLTATWLLIRAVSADRALPGLSDTKPVSRAD